MGEWKNTVDHAMRSGNFGHLLSDGGGHDGAVACKLILRDSRGQVNPNHDGIVYDTYEGFTRALYENMEQSGHHDAKDFLEDLMDHVNGGQPRSMYGRRDLLYNMSKTGFVKEADRHLYYLYCQDAANKGMEYLRTGKILGADVPVSEDYTQACLNGIADLYGVMEQNAFDGEIDAELEQLKDVFNKIGVENGLLDGPVDDLHPDGEGVFVRYSMKSSNPFCDAAKETYDDHKQASLKKMDLDIAKAEQLASGDGQPAMYSPSAFGETHKALSTAESFDAVLNDVSTVYELD